MNKFAFGTLFLLTIGGIISNYRLSKNKNREIIFVLDPELLQDKDYMQEVIDNLRV